MTVNGKLASRRDREGATLATMLAWAARDHDRTMLYGAELHVLVP